jgi:predicted nucleic acid-binding protein
VTRAVLDASVVVGLLTSRPGLDRDLLVRYDSHHAPSHIDVECVNALRGMMLGGRILSADLELLAMHVPQTPIIRYPLGPLVPRILSLARNATAYDAAYLALAEELDADLLTTDGRLAGIPGITCNVRLL